MSLNRNANEIVKGMIGAARELEIEEHSLKNGATVVDCGVHAKGSLEAGRLFSTVCLGGLASVWISKARFGKLELSTVNVETDAPRLACIDSQKAGWKVKVDDFFGLGSGPARMLLPDSNQDNQESDIGVLALECSALPDEEVAEHVASRCNIDVEKLTLLAARTASIVGSTQVSARMVETALFKIDFLRIDIAVIHATGSAPIAPLMGDDNRMMGVENDMIIYGSKVNLEVENGLDVNRLPSLSSPDYGVPFVEVFKRSGYDFYKIDQGIFAPAEVVVKNANSGKTTSAGRINAEMIEKTLAN